MLLFLWVYLLWPIASLAMILHGLYFRAGKIPGTIAAVGVNPSSSKVLLTNTYPANIITLNTLMGQLITAIENLVTALTVNAADFILVTAVPGNPSPLNPAIVTALTAVTLSLTAVNTAMGELLE